MSQLTAIELCQLILAILLLISGIYISIGAYRLFKASKKELRRLEQKLNEINNQEKEGEK